MSKIFKHVLSLVMAVLMVVPVVGSFAVSAAETQDETRTIYFLNNKGWEDVFGYTWSNDGTMKTSFPGEKLEKVGTVGYMCGGIYDVYAVEVGENDDYVIFSEGFEHGQQSSTVATDEAKDGDILIWLDDNNNSLIHYYFKESCINPVSKETETAISCEPSTISEVQESSKAIDYTSKLYFINSKNWDDVYAYTYSEEGVAETSFPGEKLEPIGYLNVWNNEIREYELKEVYLVENLGDDDDYIIFSEGYDHGQESKPVLIKYKWGGYNIVELDVNNFGTLGHFFNPDDIIPIAE